MRLGESFRGKIRGKMARASRLTGLSLALIAKKGLDQIHASSRQHPAGDLDLMIELGVVEHLKHAVNRTGLGVLGAIDQPADSGVANRSGAHGAGFHRYVEVTVR